MVVVRVARRTAWFLLGTRDDKNVGGHGRRRGVDKGISDQDGGQEALDPAQDLADEPRLLGAFVLHGLEGVGIGGHETPSPKRRKKR